MSICPGNNRPCDKVPCPHVGNCGTRPAVAPTAQWRARRWFDSASAEERQAMRELLA